MSDDYDWEQAEYEWEREYKEKADFKEEILKEVREELQDDHKKLTELREKVNEIARLAKGLEHEKLELQNRVKELEAIVEFNTTVGNISLLPWNWKD